MFPLSFSSSSSLSSIAPSLDSISELDHGLSDISEDGDRADDAETPHALRSLPPNTFSIFSHQQLAELERLVQNPTSPVSVITPETCSSELLRLEGGCEAVNTATAGPANWQHWLCTKGVVKCLSFILCFLSMLGKSGGRCYPTKLFAGLSNKLAISSPTMLQTPDAELNHLTIPGSINELSNVVQSKLQLMLHSLVTHWAHVVALLTQLYSKFLNLVTSLPSRRTYFHLLSVSLFSCPPFVSSSTLFVFPPLPSSLPPLPSYCRSNLSSSVHRYLLKPSPLFLPTLLALFLLVVMLTARQSVILALILATPLGLTLFYLESAVSSKKRTFINQKPSDQTEHQLSSVFKTQNSAPTPSHTPPHTRHHTGTTWVQETCDPAA